MNKAKALWKLMRLEHGVMIALAILVGSVIASKTLPPVDNFFLTCCTAVFLEASTFALNDYFDIEIDTKNKRMDRPLVQGDLSPHTALALFIVLFPLGIICSYLVNLTCFAIALITGLFAIVYDTKLKKIKLVGNFFIAYTMAIPFVFGGAAVLSIQEFTLNLSPAIFIIFCIAFTAGVGREIMKDVMDVKGDQKAGVKSFPQYLGRRVSLVISSLFFLIAITLSFFPFFLPQFSFYYQNYSYLFLIFITDTMLLGTTLQLLFAKQVNLNYQRKFTLIALFFGILAFFLAVFIG
jgi:geranylgeranylglycerol-phosphate geranylgeranyltransferase